MSSYYEKVKAITALDHIKEAREAMLCNIGMM